MTQQGKTNDVDGLERLVVHHDIVIERLARLCEEKDAEIEHLINEVTEWTMASIKDQHQLSEAQAQIAMQAEALNKIAGNPSIRHIHANGDIGYIESALSATSEAVAAWRAKETEPLRREVAMLNNALKDAVEEYKKLPQSLGYTITHCQRWERMISDTQSTALAYEREVENRGAVKALEDAIIRLHNDNSLLTNSDYEAELARIAEELRAANKGEVK